MDLLIVHSADQAETKGRLVFAGPGALFYCLAIFTDLAS